MLRRKVGNPRVPGKSHLTMASMLGSQNLLNFPAIQQLPENKYSNQQHMEINLHVSWHCCFWAFAGGRYYDCPPKPRLEGSNKLQQKQIGWLELAVWVIFHLHMSGALEILESLETVQLLGMFLHRCRWWRPQHAGCDLLMVCFNVCCELMVAKSNFPGSHPMMMFFRGGLDKDFLW